MKTTDELLKILKNTENISDYMQNHFEDISNITFTEYLKDLIQSHNLTRSEVIDGANIQKNYGYQIFDGSKKPSRNKVLALCFSMTLSVDESNRLLKLSDNGILYPKIQRDSIIIFALEKKQTLINANILLNEMNEDIIE